MQSSQIALNEALYWEFLLKKGKAFLNHPWAWIRNLRPRMQRKNYFFSGWIANFGVVPLLRSWALRFDPDFIFFLALRISVCFVRDAISLLPAKKSFFQNPMFGIISKVYQNLRRRSCMYQNKIQDNSLRYLPRSYLLVKRFLWRILWGLLCFLCVMSGEALGQSTERVNLQGTAEVSTIILSLGEHMEVPLQGMVNFSLGNPQVVSHKVFSQKKLLLLKAKKIGHTQLIIWESGRKKEGRKYEIYVLSKNQHLKLLNLAQVLKNLGLVVEVGGTYVKAKGRVKTVENYQIIQKLKKLHPEALVLEGDLSPKVRNSVIGTIYSFFYREGLLSISCFNEKLEIFCQYDSLTPPSKEVLTELTSLYNIHFSSLDLLSKKTNYRAKLKFIQMENIKGQEISFGLHEISGSLGEFFEIGLEGVIAKNQVALNKHSVKVSTIAESEILIQIGKPLTIRIGHDTPYESLSLQGNEMAKEKKFKFSGLKIHLKLEKLPQGLRASYQSSFSRLEGEGISGSQEASSLFIELGRPIQLFQIGHQTTGLGESSLPPFDQIPLLRNVFTWQSRQSSYKKISGLLLLEEDERSE